MSLHFLSAGPAAKHVTWSLHALTPGVVLIDVYIDGLPSSSTNIPLHWRAGTWTKPPLDLRLSSTGTLLGFDFTLQDERIAVAESTSFPAPRAGSVVFQTEGWPPDRYLDERLTVTSIRAPDGRLFLMTGEPRALLFAYQMHRFLALAFDNHHALASICLGPLSDEEWESIEAFSYVE